MSARHIEVPAESPYFAGHFPGRPILPGVAHLDLIVRELGDPPLAEVRTLKLRLPVEPGDVLDLVLEKGESGMMRFEIRRGKEAVSNGTFRIGDGGGTVEPARRLTGSFVHPAELIPHAPPALLIDTVLEASPEGVVALAVVPPESPFVRENGRAPAFLGLEAGAQAAAVLEALGRLGDAAGPQVGYVVAVRNARFKAPWLPVGRALAVTVKPAGSAPPLSVYEVAVGGGLVTGTVSTFIATAS